MALNIMSLICALLVYKWRWLINYTIFVDISYFFIWNLIPSPENVSLLWTPWNMSLQVYMGFISVYTGKSIQIFISNLYLFTFLVVKLGWVHDLPLSMYNYVTFALFAIAYFALEFMLAMLLFYVAELTKKLQVANYQNIRLLDGMHEGVLIISKTEQRVMFCNQPAQKLLNGALSYLNLLKHIVPHQRIPHDDEYLLNASMFHPVEIAVKT